jgi:glyoxylase-like metal-dependent hydrolase (beta-lactamase superfamily II)
MKQLKVIRTVILLLALAPLFVATSYAKAPLTSVQAPGYYRMKLGRFEITALSDGTSTLPVGNIMTNSTPAAISSGLHESFLAEPVDTSINAYLINTGTRLVLIDTGAGNLMGPTLGRLKKNLLASGYRPEQVDEIYLTHMHGDHVGGLVSNGKSAFSHAIVRAAEAESDFWLSKAIRDAAPAQMKSFFQGASDSVGPYIAGNRFQPFKGDTELTPGIRAVSAEGHTPGHTIYVVESDGEQLTIWGDVVHVAALQFKDPSVAIQFDTDQATAARSRKQILADASAKGYWIAGAHLSFPGIGHVGPAGSGYRFVPVNYSASP